MSKMTKPTVDVVRFTESDVIVASEIMNITGLGLGAPYGKWSFGSIDGYYSNDIVGKPDGFVDDMNAYLGTHFNSISAFGLSGSDYNVGSLAQADVDGTDVSSYDGTWKWNGSSFVQQ